MASQRARGFATLSGSVAYATAPNSAIGTIPPIALKCIGETAPTARPLEANSGSVVGKKYPNT